MGAAPTIDNEINQYLGFLNRDQKKAVLGVVKSMAQKEEDWWDDLETDAQKSIQTGLKQIKDGKLTPHLEVITKYKKCHVV